VTAPHVLTHRQRQRTDTGIFPSLVSFSSQRRSGTLSVPVQIPKEEVVKPLQPRDPRRREFRVPAFVRTKFTFKKPKVKCLTGPQDWIQGSPFSAFSGPQGKSQHLTVYQYNTNRRSLLPLIIHQAHLGTRS
jgi:hypothetical protein